MRSIRLRAFVSLLSALAISPAGRPVLADNNKRDPICERVFAINVQNELLILDVDLDKLRRASHDDDDSDGGKRVRVRWRQPITGMASGDVLVGIDFRPAGLIVGVDLVNQLYGLATIGGGAGQAQLYAINTETALATIVGPRAATLLGTSFGFDVNPATDRIRVTSDTGQNLRLNPSNGLITGIDGSLAYGPGDPNQGRIPRVTGVAHINPDTDLTTNTLPYDIDTGRESDPTPGGGDVLAVQVPPLNASQMNTIGRLHLDTGRVVGFDIGPRNDALAAVQFGTSSHLATVDLLSGRARDFGRIRSRWGDELLTGLAIELGPQCEIGPDDDDDDSDD